MFELYQKNSKYQFQKSVFSYNLLNFYDFILWIWKWEKIIYFKKFLLCKLLRPMLKVSEHFYIKLAKWSHPYFYREVTIKIKGFLREDAGDQAWFENAACKMVSKFRRKDKYGSKLVMHM